MSALTSSLVVPPEAAAMRLDQFLTQRGFLSSRELVKRAIEAGEVLVNGAIPAKAGVKLAGGEAIVCTSRVREPDGALLPDPGPLEILYEDDAILVVNKPAGLCVHPGAGNPHGTLVERVLGNHKILSPIGLPLRPGVVHRLDKGTSGVMVLAHTEAAHLHLARQFADRAVEKRYRAIVIGRMKEERYAIETAIGRDPIARKKISSRGKGKKSASTQIRVLGYKGPLTEIEALPKTGRTHQIRVHLAELGFPILGDALYGGGKRRIEGMRWEERDLQRAAALLEDPLLHAARLSFAHPVNESRVVFSAALPAAFFPFIDRAGGLS